MSLCPNGTHLANFVQDYWVFRPFFMAGEDMRNTTFKGTATFQMVALKCNFGVYNPLQSRREEKFKLIVD